MLGEGGTVIANYGGNDPADDSGTLRFVRIAGGPREERFARYTPLGSKARETSLAAMADTELSDLLTHSQPGWTAPESGYRR